MRQPPKRTRPRGVRPWNPQAHGLPKGTRRTRERAEPDFEALNISGTLAQEAYDIAHDAHGDEDDENVEE